MNSVQPIGSKDLLRLSDLAQHEILDILATAADFKRNPARVTGAMSGKSVCMLFEKPSLHACPATALSVMTLSAIV